MVFSQFWSSLKSIINEPVHDKTYNKTCATSEGSGQPTVFFSRTICKMPLKLNRQRKLLKPYKNYINDDPGLTLTNFKFVPLDFWLEKKWNSAFIQNNLCLWNEICLIWTLLNVKGQGHSVILVQGH